MSVVWMRGWSGIRRTRTEPVSARSALSPKVTRSAHRSLRTALSTRGHRDGRPTPHLTGQSLNSATEIAIRYASVDRDSHLIPDQPPRSHLRRHPAMTA
jgi:hypothetical protein